MERVKVEQDRSEVWMTSTFRTPQAGDGIAPLEYEGKMLPRIQARIDKIVESDRAITAHDIPTMIKLVDECRELGMEYTVMLLREALHWK